MFEKFDNISGIYKIVFPNNKIYIGLSSNIKKRLTAHNKTNDDLPVHRAIKKYGKISEKNVEILEIVNESLLKAEKIESRAETIENNMKIFKRKLKLIMEQQIAVVDEIEVLDLEDN